MRSDTAIHLSVKKKTFFSSYRITRMKNPFVTTSFSILGEEAPAQAPAQLQELQEIDNTLNQFLASAMEANSENMSSSEVEEKLKGIARKLGASVEFRNVSDIEGRSVCLCQFDDKVITGYGKIPQEARLDAGKAVVNHLRAKLLDA